MRVDGASATRRDDCLLDAEQILRRNHFREWSKLCDLCAAGRYATSRTEREEPNPAFRLSD